MPGEITTTSLRFARRLLQRKFRGTAGEFLVEGAQAVREAVRSGVSCRVLATDDAARAFPELVAAGYERLVDSQVRDLSDTVTPQGIFAICPVPTWALTDVFTTSSRLVVICAQVRDPGNLGTVIRCADAFGADGVVTTTGSVDLTNPKAVRASVGSIFHLPIVSAVELDQAVDAAKQRGFLVVAADGAGEDLNQAAASGGLDGSVAWILGNEAWGLPERDLGYADSVVRIPMWGRAESLNLSTAAAVCLYATASRQRGVTDQPNRENVGPIT